MLLMLITVMSRLYNTYLAYVPLRMAFMTILPPREHSSKFLLRLPFLPTEHFGNVFVSCSFTFLVVALATTVSCLVDEGTVQ